MTYQRKPTSLINISHHDNPHAEPDANLNISILYLLYMVYKPLPLYQYLIVHLNILHINPFHTKSYITPTPPPPTPYLLN